MKENQGYRWINAAYTNSKNTQLSCNLEAGEYLVIIMPEWNHNPYDMNLMYFGNVIAKIERKPYDLYKNIIP
jgi:hypothetical protein